EPVPGPVTVGGNELGSGWLGLGAAGGLRGFLVEPQGFDLDGAQGVAAARENPSDARGRARIAGGRRDRLAQCGEEAWLVPGARAGRMHVSRPILQVGRRVELPVLDLIDVCALRLHAISGAGLQSRDSVMRRVRFCSADK